MTMDDDNALHASATGIIHCLRLLADEAATLHLHGAVFAIHDAIQAVATESGAGVFAAFAEPAESPSPIATH
jgi:hypothetical protein